MIELYPIPSGIPDNIKEDRAIVIVDIFRASTSMTAALAAGAVEIHVAGSIEEAALLKKHLGNQAILAGERDGFKIEGYDLGNSPLEMTPDILTGRQVIFNSTNGTRLLRRFESYENVIVGSIVSLTATINLLSRQTVDPVICCAATVGRFSTEDVLAAGLIIERLARDESELDDAAAFAQRLIAAAGDLWLEWSKNSLHGRYLASIGLGADLDFCLDSDRYDFVPMKKGDLIIASDKK